MGELRRPPTRRLVQLYTALLYNASLKGFVEGEIFTGSSKALCTPGLNCYSCPGAVAACPLGALQNALAASGHRTGWYVFGILLLFGVVLGRTICGWLCPFGLIQELLHRIPTPKLRKSRATQALSHLKYAVLAVFAIAMPLWYGLRHGLEVPAFCKYICPAGTLEGAIGLLANPKNDGLFPMLGLLFTRKLIILLAVGLACVFCWRAFCRFLCPLGAIYALFNGIALVGVKVNADRCTGCGACVRTCGMDVRRVSDRECISCGKCIGACPTGAISMRCGRLTLQDRSTGVNPGARRRGRLAWTAALAALALVLVWVNLSGPTGGALPADAGRYAGGAPSGSGVGEQLPDFSCTLTDGRAFRLSDYRGQVVFINLWATYCAPCVTELAHFDRLQAEHPEVEILAVHAGLVTEDVTAFLEAKDWRHLDFAVDSEDGTIYAALDASAVLPRTVVLNRRGEVVYNQAGSVSYEALAELLLNADRQAPATE